MTTAVSPFRAAGLTDVGAQRVVNEDRFFADAGRGIFIVIDGVGGQAAGGRAADTALAVICTELAARSGSAADRVREAIAAANNEIHRQAATRPEWQGMACVLTVALVEGERAVVGHVGDTRLYKLRGGALQKVTHDHSPIGEREDAGEVSEMEAMQHPRRNEVYRDVGSEPRQATDPDFVELTEIAVEPDAALLLCSDGLTDLVPSATVKQVVASHAGRPEKVAEALVKAANDAGGKDNITVVYAEGPRFTATAPPQLHERRRRPLLLHSSIWLLGLIVALALAWRWADYPMPEAIRRALGSSAPNLIIVSPTESISAAIARATPGAMILVEPGEYRERLTLAGDVRVVSMVPRGAILRLPSSATDEDAAVTAVDVKYAELAGFRIVGDAASPLGIGVMTRSSNVRLLDLEITGAARTAVDIGPGDNVMLVGSDIHDNAGIGLAVRAQATARITHNSFSNNSASEQAAGAMLIEPQARPIFQGNVFRGVNPQSLPFIDTDIRNQLKTGNVFPDITATPVPARGRGRNGR
ncbi:MAG TPA: protein phosphatase 2C domain-containing protein [Vicinamibacterales bacterium]|nr:protein phosphatase 2C domain-containing protein [Vicinamibacterales bacterium]